METSVQPPSQITAIIHIINNALAEKNEYNYVFRIFLERSGFLFLFDIFRQFYVRFRAADYAGSFRAYVKQLLRY